MAESIFPSWVSEGLSIAGAAKSLLGGGGGTPNWQRRIHEQDNIRQHDAFYNPIHYRVRDAQNSGVHPLFALGAQISSPSPIPVMESGQSGPTLSDEAVKLATVRSANALAEKDFAQASYFKALEAKIRQTPQAEFPDLGDAAGWVGGAGGGSGDLVHQGRSPEVGAPFQPFMDRRRLDPSVVKSHAFGDPSVEAATGVAWKRWTLDDQGFQMVLPAADTLSEALEALSESKTLLAWVIAENVRRGGQKWLTDFTKMYGQLIPW